MVRTVIAQHRLPRKSVLRVECKAGVHCFIHTLGFANRPEHGDISCHSRGFAICMDANVASLLRGTTID